MVDLEDYIPDYVQAKNIPGVTIEITHRALGGKIEPIRQAIHLEFNYREGNQPAGGNQ